MNELDVFYRIADVSLAVFAVLFVGWRVDRAFTAIVANQQNIIELLIHLCADKQKDGSRDD